MTLIIVFGVLVLTIFIITMSILRNKKNTIEKMKSMQSLSDKHLALFRLMNQWVMVKQQKKSLVGYLKQRGYCNIAIYGMGDVGETLVSELEGSDINIMYGIDKKIDYKWRNFAVYCLDDEFEEVDAVVVTAITYFREIKEEVSKKLNCPIISLEDILYDV